MTVDLRYSKIPCVIKKVFFNNTALPLHIHSQYELVYLRMQKGAKQIGNHRGPIKDDELLLISPNLPHYWETHNKIQNEFCIGIHFDSAIFGERLFNYSPFIGIQKLLKRANQGVSLKGEFAASFGATIESMLGIDELDQSLELIRLLNRLSGEEYELLSTLDYGDSNNNCAQSKRMINVMHYITLHYKENISLKDIAEVANMTPQAFCKYFKEATNKTFVEFVNEIRLRYACKLLLDVNYSISQICYESGFNSMTNFNRQFRRVVNMSPTAYRSQVLSPNPSPDKTRCDLKLSIIS